MEKGLLIAIGGNALLSSVHIGSAEQEKASAERIADRIVEIVQRGYRVVITHGNGPQIGSQLLRSEMASSQTYALPLDLCVSMTQVEIGCLLQRSLKALLIRHGMNQPVVTLITQVQVDPSDMAFEHPSKPIGPSLSADVAVRRQRELGWCIVEDSPRRFRRAVPSPRPMAIVELEAIRACLNENMIVITAGGGGIPVVRDNGHFSGVDAVIDKDRVSALLASELGVETLLMCTDVEYVYLNFGTPQQTPFHLLHVPEAHRYLEEGEFGVGSMRPKIESALEFLSRGGREVMITDAQHLVAAMGGLTGTHVME